MTLENDLIGIGGSDGVLQLLERFSMVGHEILRCLKAFCFFLVLSINYVFLAIVTLLITAISMLPLQNFSGSVRTLIAIISLSILLTLVTQQVVKRYRAGEGTASKRSLHILLLFNFVVNSNLLLADVVSSLGEYLPSGLDEYSAVIFITTFSPLFLFGILAAPICLAVSVLNRRNGVLKDREVKLSMGALALTTIAVGVTFAISYPDSSASLYFGLLRYYLILH